MTDIELQALTALVEADRMEMQADNEQRTANGFAPAWDSKTQWPNLDRLQTELKRRGIVE